MTIGTSCGHSTPSKSFRENDRSGNSGIAPAITTYMSRLAYAHLALPESPPPLFPSEMTLTLPMPAIISVLPMILLVLAELAHVPLGLRHLLERWRRQQTLVLNL
ncbi:hypothetical protein LIER_06868 [Lithospermum erythrorhizon]|uniref:Uncharacterized protein n=1 Tax=Lithospermum erythrorhizon TaxID=34254 RepID=A0AAV3P7I1_LITER